MKNIMYAIDLEGGVIVSRVGNEYAWPVLDFDGMTPENNFETKYNLEKFKITELNYTDFAHLKWTKKLPLGIKNLHRQFWGLKPVKPSPKYCPKCGEYWKKDKCKTNNILQDQFGNPVPDDLVLLPNFNDLDLKGIECVDKAKWYEQGNVLMASYDEICGLSESDPIDAGIKPETGKIMYVNENLHRWNEEDGFYHA